MQLDDVIDAKGPGRALLHGQVNVAYLKVVEAAPEVAADLAGLALRNGWVRGIRDGVLMPQGADYRAIMLIERSDNPRLFGPKDDDTPKAVDVGRIAKGDLGKWAQGFRGKPLSVALYVGGTPRYEGVVEARFYPARLAEDFEEQAADESPAATAPVAPAGWYADPREPWQQRWWDGTAWTEQTQAR